ncbi:MAG TPA: CoA transferase [Candidatus Binataceae bacterium]|jgi:crotonobetainyl-CoA:carnitine CoA-transferase CaiB-like acyl-CoA transferase|nr:CoA transferase [Candidatus Binataceae bacterium]
MTGPLSGIKVVELAIWLAGPAAGAMLADWGADVIKIEPPEGDPFRALSMGSRELGRGEVNPMFHVDNRGKRGVALDLKKPRGLEIAYEMVAGADVFLTNMRVPSLEKMKMDYESLKQVNRRLVYTILTGYGLAGPDRDKAGYDVGSYWARAGVAFETMGPDAEPLFRAGGIGDHNTAVAAVAGTCAALNARHSTGEGQLVATSLMRMGTYYLSSPMFTALRGIRTPPVTREKSFNVAINCYRDSERKWFWLLGLQGDRAWPGLMRAIGRPELIGDPRYESHSKRYQHARDLVAMLDQIFATKTLSEWGAIFDREDVWWCPVQSAAELMNDPQAEGAGLFVDVPKPEGGVMRQPAGPVDFYGTPWRSRSVAPEFGQDTETVLLEMGRSWEDIAQLKSEGVIP